MKYAYALLSKTHHGELHMGRERMSACVAVCELAVASQPHYLGVPLQFPSVTVLPAPEGCTDHIPEQTSRYLALGEHRNICGLGSVRPHENIKYAYTQVERVRILHKLNLELNHRSVKYGNYRTMRRVPPFSRRRTAVIVWIVCQCRKKLRPNKTTVLVVLG
jgi:hypothetical protein